MSEPLPAAPALQAELDQFGLATTPWELQGALIGWIAGGGDADREWLRKVMADPALPALADGSAIGHFGRGTQARIEDNDLDLTLLLPDEDATLQARSAALFDWCRHFLGAFGLAAGAEPPLSDEGEEALQDLARLATATAEPDGDEEDEAALAEIEEFVRVAALLLHGDVAIARRRRQLH